MTLTGPKENKGFMHECLEKAIESIEDGNDSKDVVIAFVATECGHTGDYVWRTLKLWIALDRLRLKRDTFSIGNGVAKKKKKDAPFDFDEDGHIKPKDEAKNVTNEQNRGEVVEDAHDQ